MKLSTLTAFAAALLFAALFTGFAWALEWTSVTIDEDFRLKVSASPAEIDFGTANKGSNSQQVVLQLTNDESVQVTVLALHSSDPQVRIVSAIPATSLSLEGEVVPTPLDPGANLSLTLQYINADREGAITGTLSALTLGGGSEETTIGFKVASAGTGTAEDGPHSKPQGEWFFGSCFLGTLGLP